MYKQINKFYPWLSFDEIDLDFSCAACNTKTPISQEAINSGNGEEEAKKFVEKHKGCSV